MLLDENLESEILYNTLTIHRFFQTRFWFMLTTQYWSMRSNQEQLEVNENPDWKEKKSTNLKNSFT